MEQEVDFHPGAWQGFGVRFMNTLPFLFEKLEQESARPPVWPRARGARRPGWRAGGLRAFGCCDGG